MATYRRPEGEGETLRLDSPFIQCELGEMFEVAERCAKIKNGSAHTDRVLKLFALGCSRRKLHDGRPLARMSLSLIKEQLGVEQTQADRIKKLAIECGVLGIDTIGKSSSYFGDLFTFPVYDSLHTSEYNGVKPSLHSPQYEGVKTGVKPSLHSSPNEVCKQAYTPQTEECVTLISNKNNKRTADEASQKATPPRQPKSDKDLWDVLKTAEGLSLSGKAANRILRADVISRNPMLEGDAQAIEDTMDSRRNELQAKFSP